MNEQRTNELTDRDKIGLTDLVENIKRLDDHNRGFMFGYAQAMATLNPRKSASEGRRPGNKRGRKPKTDASES